MKANSSRSSRGTQWRTFLVWVVIALLVLTFAGSFVRSLTSGATSFFFSVRHYFATSPATIPVFIRGRAELLDEMNALKAEIEAQRGLRTTVEYLTEENTMLKNLRQGSSTEEIIAGVIARPPYTPYDTIVIDKGSADGILLHAPVYYGQGMALGLVREVFAHTALVTPFSSPGIKATVYVFGAHIFTTAYGDGGGVIRLSVPQGILLTEGNLVTLPSLRPGVLGTIQEIQSNPTEPEQRAYITFDIPIQSLRSVAVGTTPIVETAYQDAVDRVAEEENKLLSIDVPVMNISATAESTTTARTGTVHPTTPTTTAITTPTTSASHQ